MTDPAWCLSTVQSGQEPTRSRRWRSAATASLLSDPTRTYATVEGAKANGLDSKVGTLTPGKQADVIMLRTDRMNVTPLNDPATAVVVGMDTGNVDTVLIGGRVMKRNGQLLHVDWPAVRRLAVESRDHVVAKSGFKLPRI